MQKELEQQKKVCDLQEAEISHIRSINSEKFAEMDSLYKQLDHYKNEYVQVLQKYDLDHFNELNLSARKTEEWCV